MRQWAGTGPAASGGRGRTSICVWPALAAHHVEATLGPLLPAGLRTPDQQQVLERTGLRTQWLLLELERVLPGCRRRACDPILLKGAGLALAVYPDPAERWFIDLDLLETPGPGGGRLRRPGGRRLPARSAAAATGSTTTATTCTGSWSTPARCGGGGALGPEHRRFPLPLRSGGDRARARLVAIGRHACRVAAPVDLVIHGVYQDLADGFIDLRRLLDLARLLPGLSPADWDTIWELANAGRMDRALELSLHLMKNILGIEAPPGRPAHPLEPWAWRLLDGLDVAAGCLARRSAVEVGYNRFLHLVLVPGAKLRRHQVGRLLWPRLQPVAGREPDSWQLGLLHCAAAGARNALRIVRIGAEALRGNPA